MAAQEYPNNSDKRAQRITNSKESTSPAIDNMSPALTRIHPKDLFFMLFDEAPEAYLCLTDTGTVIHETGEEGRGVHFEIIVPSGTYRTEELSSHGETE